MAQAASWNGEEASVEPFLPLSDAGLAQGDPVIANKSRQQSAGGISGPKPSTSPGPDKSGAGHVACGEEAVKLLNCIAALNYQEGRCAVLMGTLRRCCEKKNVRNFSLLGEESMTLEQPQGKTAQVESKDKH